MPRCLTRGIYTKTNGSWPNSQDRSLGPKDSASIPTSLVQQESMTAAVLLQAWLVYTQILPPVQLLNNCSRCPGWTSHWGRAEFPKLSCQATFPWHRSIPHPCMYDMLACCSFSLLQSDLTLMSKIKGNRGLWISSQGISTLVSPTFSSSGQALCWLRCVDPGICWSTSVDTLVLDIPHLARVIHHPGCAAVYCRHGWCCLDGLYSRITY